MTKKQGKIEPQFDNLTPKEACELLGLSPKLIQPFIRSGELPNYKLRRKIFINKTDLKNWWESRKKGAIETKLPKENLNEILNSMTKKEIESLKEVFKKNTKGSKGLTKFVINRTDGNPPIIVEHPLVLKSFYNLLKQVIKQANDKA